MSNKNNLPFQLTSFVGREAEVGEVQRLLETTRLLTLTGTGGMGKTRLALQAAAEVLPRLSEGVWLVELAALADPTFVPQAVAAALGVQEEPDRPLLVTLSDALRPKHLLLVLDNCEHLIDACARVVDTLLRSCPRLQVLATSRAALGVAGETVWRVPSLRLVVVQAGGARASTQQVAQVEAVRLFVERATAAQPGFVLSDQNALVVAQICQSLDGIPLALELAAARMRVLSAEQLLGRLTDRFGLLRGGSRTALARQQTLQATVDWSYELLSVPERRLFERLSVFAGGFTLEAAEGVGAGDGIGAAEVLELLGQLVDRSLVQVEPDVQGGARNRLLETLREYARERLEESGAAGGVQVRHAAYYLGLAEQAEPHLRGRQQVEWLARLEVEHDNLRAALRWCVERGEAERVQRLGAALWRFWYVRGHLSEGRERLAEVLKLGTAKMASGSGRAARAAALRGAAALARLQGDYAAARSWFEESLAIWRELGHQLGIASSLNGLAIVALHRGDSTAARALCEDSLTASRAVGDRWGIARSLYNLGLVVQGQGDYTAARALYEDSLAISRELGDKWGIAYSLDKLGLVAQGQGDNAAARTLCTEGLAIRRELGNRLGIAYSLNNLGIVALQQGDDAEASSCFEASLAIARELGSKRLIAEALEGFAGAAATQGQAERALRLAGATANLRESIGAPLSPAEQERLQHTLQPARRALSEQAAAGAWADGQALSVEQTLVTSGVLGDERNSGDDRLKAMTLNHLGEVEALPGACSQEELLAAANDILRLSPREREVAGLIASGLTNREIAERLLIAERTVATHV